MNVLMIAPHGMYGHYSSSFIHNQARAYAALGHQVRVVIPLAYLKRSNEGKRFGRAVEAVTRDGVEVCFVRCLSLSSLGARGTHGLNHRFAKLAVELHNRRLLRGFQPDVVHAQTVDFGGSIGLYFKKKYGIPLLITTHGGDTTYPMSLGGGKRLKKVCDQADSVVAVSSALGRKLAACGTRTPIRTILNGFSIENVGRRQRAAHQIIQVGHLISSKRVEVTLRAAARLWERWPDLTVKIVGQGPLEQTLKALCTRLELTDAVEFTGQLDNAATLQVMAQSEVFLMPSVDEGFGIVYLEAMASGCLTIGTEGEGIADLIVSGENGFLVPPDDVDAVVRTIDECFEHPEKTARIASAGRESALRLTWEYNAEQYLSLLYGLQEESICK